MGGGAVQTHSTLTLDSKNLCNENSPGRGGGRVNFRLGSVYLLLLHPTPISREWCISAHGLYSARYN